ncbi:MAG TPA: DUF885 domain-containing protein [Candidatus Choladousia intestinigallinarum]|nr:DUF885 domain-containing protein [Candidatus Choladousia intestinigallinarum]
MPAFLSKIPSRGRRLILLILAVLLGGAAFLWLGIFQSEENKFQSFAEEVFTGELSGNTLNLHYTVADPSAYGLKDYPVTLGSCSPDSHRQSLSVLENYRKSLGDFSYEKLSASSQLTYDIFRDYLDTELAAGSMYLYEEPLGPTLGIQAQLPILFAEYRFRVKKDIEDYLQLLSQVPDYFSSILSFEQEKSRNGLFMSDDTADSIIAQCREFTADPQNNYLLEIFNDKIQSISNLSEDEKIDYQTRNSSILTSLVIPAYEELAEGLTALKGTGTNSMGLYYWPKGREYYEYLVKSRVGDSRSIPEIEEAVKTQMVEDYGEMVNLIRDSGGNLELEDTLTSPALSSPEEMLEDLRGKIMEDFPLPPQVQYQVKYVHDSLQEYLSPAFYLTPCIDDYQSNVIYINPAGNYQGLDLYTTLAHEGYPGHLYQSVYFEAAAPDLLRSILGTEGYTEGWATYVEMYSFSLWEGDPTQAALAQKNRSFTLGLASLLDIGIHYRGYTREDAAKFLEQLGFSQETASSLYDSILESPANYLQYYVGCLNFYELRDYARELMGNDFSLKKFHQAVLDAGSAPFPILKKYLAETLTKG